MGLGTPELMLSYCEESIVNGSLMPFWIPSRRDGLAPTFCFAIVLAIFAMSLLLCGSIVELRCLTVHVNTRKT